jgi:hypothetical protein
MPEFANYSSSDYFVAPIRGGQGVVMAFPFGDEGPTTRRMSAKKKFFPGSYFKDYNLNSQSVKNLESLVSQGAAQKKEQQIKYKDTTSKYAQPEPGSPAESWSSPEDVPDSYILYSIPDVLYTMGFRVNHDNNEIDMDLSFLGYMTRRGGEKPDSNSNREPPSYVTPSGDATEASEQEIKKLLKHVQKKDSRDIIDYTIVGNEKYRGMTVRDLLTRSKSPETERLLNPSSTDIVAYHGTTSTLAKKILEKGLRPGKSQYTYLDQVKGWSESNVYLTLSPANAENYATRAAIWYGGTPTVLKVTVPDPAKIVADEDSWGWIELDPPVKINVAVPTSRFRQSSEKIKEVEVNKLHIGNWFRDKSRGVYDNASPEQIEAIESQIAKTMITSLKEGIKSGDAAFAYRGAILPKFIKKWRAYPKKSYGPESKLSQEKYDKIRREVQARMKRFDEDE